MENVKNYMEEIVETLLDDVLNSMNVCKCELCREDITALALNELPPKYIVTAKGERYSKLSFLKQQFEVDIIAAITKAAITVSKRPRHE